MIGNTVSDVDETGDRTPAEWLKTPRFHGWHLIDRDGWSDGSWEQPITIDEFQRRISECTISVNVDAAIGAGAEGLRISSRCVGAAAGGGGRGRSPIGHQSDEEYLASCVTDATNKLNMLLELAAQNGIDADIDIAGVTAVTYPARRRVLTITLKNGAR